jgi:peptidoglycan/xylan/chitin deacetylase (PgdA/CDA1 family)
MKRLMRRWLPSVLLILVATCLLSLPAITSARTSLSSLSFGSEEVLRSCWSAEELQGKPQDKIIVFERDLLPLTPKLNALLKDLCPSKPAPAGSIRRVIPTGNQKVIALTFDLCERADEITGYDYEIVNYLRAHEIRATFFAGGKWMQSHPDKAMQLMADPLFEIGNHTWSHANLRVMGKDEGLAQILLTQAQYRELRRKLAFWPCARQAGMQELAKIPAIPQCFRFPYGTCSAEALQILKSLNLPAIQWDIVTDDSEKDQTAEKIAGIVLTHARPGSIIVCHANARGHHTAEALPLFVPELQRRGYTFVTISELLTCGPVYAVSECYELTRGDNKRYDKLFGKGTERPKKQVGLRLHHDAFGEN